MNVCSAMRTRKSSFVLGVMPGLDNIPADKLQYVPQQSNEFNHTYAVSSPSGIRGGVQAAKRFLRVLSVQSGTIITELPGEATLNTENARKLFDGRGCVPDPAGEAYSAQWGPWRWSMAAPPQDPHPRARPWGLGLRTTTTFFYLFITLKGSHICNIHRKTTNTNKNT